MTKKYILSILAENHTNVLNRILGLLSRKGYNITHLTFRETKNYKLSIVKITLYCDEYEIDQITKNLEKLEDVIKVNNKYILTNIHISSNEIMDIPR